MNDTYDNDVLAEFIRLLPGRPRTIIAIGSSGIEFISEPLPRPITLGASLAFPIGRDLILVEPIVLEQNGTISYLENGEERCAIRIADSVAKLMAILDPLRELSEGRENPVLYAKNPPGLGEIEQFIRGIERDNPGSDSGFWRDLLEQEWAREEV